MRLVLEKPKNWDRFWADRIVCTNEVENFRETYGDGIYDLGNVDWDSPGIHQQHQKALDVYLEAKEALRYHDYLDDLSW